MTRRQGVVKSAAGLGPFGHLGWGFRDRTEFLARAAEYIVDGLAYNQLVEYVGRGSRDQLRAELAGAPGMSERLASGSIQVTPIADYYSFRPGSEVLDPQRGVADYVAAAERAIDDGYTGFRAVVDVTWVARSAEQRDALARLEYLVGRKMAVLPVAMLCAYDIGELSAAASELICLHPFVERSAPSFRLYAQPLADFALAGEIDASNAELFSTTMNRVFPMTACKKLFIDAKSLEFITRQQLHSFDRYAHTNGREVVLYTDQPVLTRLAELLDLTNVRVDAPATGCDNAGQLHEIW